VVRHALAPTFCPVVQRRDDYVIGYPTTNLRPSGEGAAIEKKEYRLKRWSRGFGSYFKISNPTVDGPEQLIGTTADSLPSSSGGPAVDTSGHLEGVVVKSASIERNHFKYTGNEREDGISYHTFLVPCDSVKIFLDENLVP
jgi:hypothetical protein